MHIEAETINCDLDYECQNLVKTCANGEDCIIHCTRYRSCYGAHFTCPTSTNPNNELLCQVTCGDGTSLSSETCRYASFNASGSSTLTLTIDSFDGSSTNSQGITVGCPKNGFCNIGCGNAYRGCYYMEIYGEQSALMVSSSGTYGYYDIKVFASQTSSLTMIATARDAFWGSEIYCPKSNKQQPPRCNITYSNTDGSYGFGYQTTFYCVDSFWDLNLFCPEFSSTSCISSSSSNKPIMRCLSDYSQSCTMTTNDGKYWTCESSNSACAVRVPTPPPTASPTASPSAKSATSSVVIISISTTISTLIVGSIIAFIIWWFKCRKSKVLSKSIIKKKNSVQKYHSLAENQEQNNGLMSKYQIGSSVKNWNKSDIINWVKGIGLSSNWEKDIIKTVENKNIKGQNMMHLQSGKDIGKLFELENPMLCSRLWRELKKVK